MKKAVLLPILLYCFTSIGISQTMIVEPLGMSPRDVAEGRVDTTFDRAYNGLLNVGLETQMYLKGTFVDSSLTSAAWAIDSAPGGSVATLGTPVVLDTATEAIAFAPDLAGTYVISFTEGTYIGTVTIHAGTYIGGVLPAEELAMTSFTGMFKCQTCHPDEFAGLGETGHYTLFEHEMTGNSNHYGGHCIGCHTTGYDALADNGGFDDRVQTVSYLEKDTTFVFPGDSLTLATYYGRASTADSTYMHPAVWDSLFSFFPNTMIMARIQCESCHGPGSQHMAMPPPEPDRKISASISTDGCAICHDSGTHHVYPEQWDASGHANPPTRASWSASCARCHTPEGFIEYSKPDGTVEAGPESPFSCAMCHDPHSADTPHQVREVETVLSNGEPVKGGGLGKLCMNCHMGRRNAAEYPESQLGNPSSHFGPHYGVQADVLSATNVVTFGRKLPTTSGHLAGNSCVDCHMAEGHADAEGNIILAGSHSWNMEFPDETDNVEACAECHGEIGESFADKPFISNFITDHDGDGVDEGLQEEVHGLMEHLATLLPHHPDSAGYDAHYALADATTLTELKAAYNFQVVYYDHSYGVHNPAFTVALLHTTIEALEAEYIPGAIVAIEDVPNDQGNQVRIVWEKFNGFEPVDFYLINRLDDWTAAETTWTTVGMLPAYDAERFALVVPTAFNAATTFEVVATFWDESEMRSGPGEGTSVDNLVPTAPMNVIALAASGVSLSWEAPADPVRDTDINFYKIYRSTVQGFVPSYRTELATTTDLFYDDPVTDGTYYYRIVAEDFNGNQGDASLEADVSLAISETGLPTEYALAQNFPNPFNPSTNIKFQLREMGHVSMVIYDHIGREVLTLIDQPMSAGYHNVTVGADRLASGVYFYRVRVNDFTSTKKMLLLK
ncbi:T9SS type A sorting domain-containing protein [Candidatus Neomarinimicrobiota bacterium]